MVPLAIFLFHKISVLESYKIPGALISLINY
jgi:hypothetical protein